MAKNKKYSKGGKLPKYQNGGDPPVKIDVVDNLPTINIPIGSPLNPLTKSSTDYAHRENDRYMFGQQPDAYQSPYKEYQQQLFRQYQSDPSFMYDINKQGFNTYADLSNLNKGSLKGQYVPDEQGFTFEPQYSLPEFTVQGEIAKPKYKDAKGGNWKNWDKLTPEEKSKIKTGKFKNKYEMHLIENKATYDPGEWIKDFKNIPSEFVKSMPGTAANMVGNTFSIPMALMTEGLEHASGKPYNYSNAFDVMGDSQRTLSDVMDVDPTTEMIVDPGNFIPAGLASKVMKGSKFLKPTVEAVDDLASASIKGNISNLLSKVKVPQKIKDADKIISEGLGTIAGKVTGKNKRALEEANEFLDYWTNHPATKDKMVRNTNMQTDIANQMMDNYEKELAKHTKEMEEFRKLSPEEQWEVGGFPIRPVLDPKAYQYKIIGPEKLEESFSRASPEVEFYPLKQQVKDLFTDRKHIHDGNLGVYYHEGSVEPRADRAWLSRDHNPKGKASTGIHEGTHKWTKGNELLTDIEKLAIKKSLDPEHHKLSHRYWDNPKSSLEYWKGYYADPTEVHARVMELRNFYGIKPDDIINKNQAEKILKDVWMGKTQRKNLTSPASLDNPTRKLPVDKAFAKAMVRNKNKKWDENTYKSFAKMMNTLRTTAPVAGGAGAAGYLLNENNQEMKAYGGMIGGPGDDKKKSKDVNEQSEFYVEGQLTNPYEGKSYHAYPAAQEYKDFVESGKPPFKRTFGDRMYDIFHATPRVRTVFANGGPINPPIKTSNPADPALHNYLDSLNLYNAYQTQLKFNPENTDKFARPRMSDEIKYYENASGLNPENYFYINTPAEMDAYVKKSEDLFKKYGMDKNDVSTWDRFDELKNDPAYQEHYSKMPAATNLETYSHPKYYPSDSDKKLAAYYNTLSFYNPTSVGGWDTPDLGNKKIRPIENYTGGGAWNPVYKKPVQPYEYTGDPKDLEKYRNPVQWAGSAPKEKSSRLKDLMADAGDTDYSFAHRKEIAKSLGIDNYTGSLEQNKIMKDYFKNAGKESAIEVENVSTNIPVPRDIEHKVKVGVAPVNAVPTVSTPQPVKPVSNMKPKEEIVPKGIYRGTDAFGNPVYDEQLSRVRYYAMGGPINPPIKVDDPNDPRYMAYQDSLAAYETAKKFAYLTGQQDAARHKEFLNKVGRPEAFKSGSEIHLEHRPTEGNIEKEFATFYNPNTRGMNQGYVEDIPGKIRPIGLYGTSVEEKLIGDWGIPEWKRTSINVYPRYKKPVQPYEYTGEAVERAKYTGKTLPINIEKEKSSRLKDLMANAGDSDYSFAHRAEIAKQLGIEGEYTGSVEQNKILKDYFKNAGKQSAIEVEPVSTNVPVSTKEHKVKAEAPIVTPKQSMNYKVQSTTPSTEIVSKKVYRGLDSYGNPIYDQQLSRNRYYAYGGYTQPQYEAEKGEVVDGGMPVAFNGGTITPNSMTSGKINGQTHEQGGVDMAGGKRVFSDRLTVDSNFLNDLDI